jgi:hypothetical protein
MGPTGPDILSAIESGELPGARAPDGLAWNFPPVESQKSTGGTLVWQVSVELLSSAGDPAPIVDADLALPADQLPKGWSARISARSYQSRADGSQGADKKGGVPTIVTAGKNVGKKNATNVLTQAMRDAWSKYNAHVRRAGSANLNDAVVPAARAACLADAVVPAAAALPLPQLVKVLGKGKSATPTPAEWAAGLSLQRKLNGLRMVAMFVYDASLGQYIVSCIYSRTGSGLPGFATLEEQLNNFAATFPPVDAEVLRLPAACGQAASAEETERHEALYRHSTLCLDGEIYAHGRALQWISGQARRDADSPELVYTVFDAFWPDAKAEGADMVNECRSRWLAKAFAAARAESAAMGFSLDRVALIESFPIYSMAQVDELTRQFLEEGYEGSILRRNCAGYDYGVNNYHSSNVLKIKPSYDDEFPVVGFTQGTKGKDVGAVVWIAEVTGARALAGKDNTFNVVPKDMSYEDRYRLFECLSALVPNSPENVAKGGPERVSRFERDIKGLPLTVKFDELSVAGKPLRAKAVAFRTYEGGTDPVKALFEDCGVAASS